MTNLKTSTPLWDALCLSSLFGIWPRFIEPSLICTTKITLKKPGLPQSLHGLKILQISDLHLHPNVPNRFLKKLISKIQRETPDLIVLTGDFLCHGRLTEPDRMLKLLNQMHAKYGCYAVLGNHDYSVYIAINADGDYDILPPPLSPVASGFKRLSRTIKLTKKTTQAAKNIPLNAQLCQLLKKTPFKLLHNETTHIEINGYQLNITGLGEHMLGRVDAKAAFSEYDQANFGLVLLHNPDGLPSIANYPGDIVLCGHTHGGQINLPWVWKKFTVLENMNFKKGALETDKKWMYINRGLGSAMPIRLFSPPEILCLTLEGTV